MSAIAACLKMLPRATDTHMCTEQTFACGQSFIAFCNSFYLIIAVFLDGHLWLIPLERDPYWSGCADGTDQPLAVKFEAIAVV